MDVIVKPWPYDEDEYNDGPGHSGAAHSVSGDGPDYDIIEKLHQVVEEVTGMPVPRPAKKIGFY
jgi:hypothetical protein